MSGRRFPSSRSSSSHSSSSNIRQNRQDAGARDSSVSRRDSGQGKTAVSRQPNGHESRKRHRSESLGSQFGRDNAPDLTRSRRFSSHDAAEVNRAGEPRVKRFYKVSDKSKIARQDSHGGSPWSHRDVHEERIVTISSRQENADDRGKQPEYPGRISSTSFPRDFEMSSLPEMSQLSDEQFAMLPNNLQRRSRYGDGHGHPWAEFMSDNDHLSPMHGKPKAEMFSPPSEKMLSPSYLSSTQPLPEERYRPSVAPMLFGSLTDQYRSQVRASSFARSKLSSDDLNESPVVHSRLMEPVLQNSSTSSRRPSVTKEHGSQKRAKDKTEDEGNGDGDDDKDDVFLKPHSVSEKDRSSPPISISPAPKRRLPNRDFLRRSMEENSVRTEQSGVSFRSSSFDSDRLISSCNRSWSSDAVVTFDLGVHKSWQKDEEISVRSKSHTQSQTQTDAQSKMLPNAQSQTQPNTQSQTQPQTQPDAQPQTQPDTQSLTQPHTESLKVSHTQFQTKPHAQSQELPQTQPQSQSQTLSHTQSQSDAKSPVTASSSPPVHTLGEAAKGCHPSDVKLRATQDLFSRPIVSPGPSDGRNDVNESSSEDVATATFNEQNIPHEKQGSLIATGGPLPVVMSVLPATAPIVAASEKQDFSEAVSLVVTTVPPIEVPLSDKEKPNVIESDSNLKASEIPQTEESNDSVVDDFAVDFFRSLGKDDMKILSLGDDYVIDDGQPPAPLRSTPPPCSTHSNFFERSFENVAPLPATSFLSEAQQKVSSSSSDQRASSDEGQPLYDVALGLEDGWEEEENTKYQFPADWNVNWEDKTGSAQPHVEAPDISQAQRNIILAQLGITVPPQNYQVEDEGRYPEVSTSTMTSNPGTTRQSGQMRWDENSRFDTSSSNEDDDESFVRERSFSRNRDTDWMENKTYGLIPSVTNQSDHYQDDKSRRLTNQYDHYQDDKSRRLTNQSDHYQDDRSRRLDLSSTTNDEDERLDQLRAFSRGRKLPYTRSPKYSDYSDSDTEEDSYNHEEDYHSYKDRARGGYEPQYFDEDDDIEAMDEYFDEDEDYVDGEDGMDIEDGNVTEVLSDDSDAAEEGSENEIDIRSQVHAEAKQLVEELIFHVGSLAEEEEEEDEAEPDEVRKGSVLTDEELEDLVVLFLSDILNEVDPSLNFTAEQSTSYNSISYQVVHGPPDTVLIADKSLEVNVTRCSLKTLIEEVPAKQLTSKSHVNDEVINSYMNLLRHRSTLYPELPKVFVFNTFFFESLRNGGHDRVKRWTRGKDIFQYDMIVVPLNFKSEHHWALFIIDLTAKKLLHYDSLLNRDLGKFKQLKLSKQVRIFNMFRSYLEKEIVQKKSSYSLDHLKSYEVDFCTKYPQQRNLIDCGVFCMRFAEAYTRRGAIDYCQAEMLHYRKQICLELFDRKIPVAP